MHSMKFTLLLALLAFAIRAGMYYGGIAVAPFRFAPLHLLFLVMIAWYSGHALLRMDPTRGMGELMRAAFQSVVVYSLVSAILIWAYYTAIDDQEFLRYNERLIQGFVAQGHPEAMAREKVGSLYTGGSYAVLTFFGLFMAGTVNALLFAFLHDKLLRRFRR